jgi:hypothetical protein
MKLKIVRSLHIDIDKARIQEVWPKFLDKNTIIYDVVSIQDVGAGKTNIVTDSGDVYLEIPKDAFEHVL